MEKEFYERNLPHIQPQNGVFFVTYRLAGSLSRGAIDQLNFEREMLRKSGYRPDGNHMKYSRDLLFERFEELLDSATTGPVWLERKDIAGIVRDTLHYADSHDYKLICYSIMSNHVHLILYKCAKPLYRILQSVKRASARKANIELGRSGEFWAKESYDNQVRDMNDLMVKVNYVLMNPVRAGIVKNWEEHEFTYCRKSFLQFVNP